MSTRRIFTKLLAGGGLAALGAVPALAQPVPPYPPGYAAPPPLRYEAPPPPPPSRAYVWRPGHWRWDGVRYLWVRGEYILRQPSWHRWIDGHWAVVYGRWTWVPGHWG